MVQLLFCLATLIATPHPGVGLEVCEKVKPGMTKQEVKAIFGDAKPCCNPDWPDVWSWPVGSGDFRSRFIGERGFLVIFDKAGRVDFSGIHVCAPGIR